MKTRKLGRPPGVLFGVYRNRHIWRPKYWIVLIDETKQQLGEPLFSEVNARLFLVGLDLQSILPPPELTRWGR